MKVNSNVEVVQLRGEYVCINSNRRYVLDRGKVKGLDSGGCLSWDENDLAFSVPLSYSMEDVGNFFLVYCSGFMDGLKFGFDAADRPLTTPHPNDFYYL